MFPVAQAPLSEVAVCVAAVALVQATADPAVTTIGLGLKHQVVAAHAIICAGEVAAAVEMLPESRRNVTSAGMANSLRIKATLKKEFKGDTPRRYTVFKRRRTSS